VQPAFAGRQAQPKPNSSKIACFIKQKNKQTNFLLKINRLQRYDEKYLLNSLENKLHSSTFAVPKKSGYFKLRG